MSKSDRRTRRVWLNSIAAIVSLIVVAIYVGNLGFNPVTSPIQPSISTVSAADKVATQFKLIQYNDAGGIDHSLSAKKAEFFKLSEAEFNSLPSQEVELDDAFSLPFATDDDQRKRDVVLLYSPHLRVDQQAENYSVINANHGQYFPGNRQIKLGGSVKLYDASTDTSLTTELLTIDAAQKQVLTESDVKLSNPQSVITATGLSGDLTQQRWRLLDKVKSTVHTREKP